MFAKQTRLKNEEKNPLFNKTIQYNITHSIKFSFPSIENNRNQRYKNK